MSESKRYRECMAEINGVLKKYDMAGAITVVDKERAMFKYVFPTWGAIKFEGSDKIRLRALRKDYATDAEHMRALELSAHIIMQFRDIAAQTFSFCQHLADSIGKQLTIEHQPYADFDPEREH